jgi:2-polyprenyl-6-methoxyphenol hydroxylase-like FAD-dependent oxidoreductase
MGDPEFDVCVVGGGSGGFGAALAAARLGRRVCLVEREDTLGGTAVHAGVHCWEMGAGGTGIPFDLYRRLRPLPDAIGIYTLRRHCLWHDPKTEPYVYPGSESVIDPTRAYLDTLQRHGSRGLAEDEAFCREHFHGLPFESAPMAATMQQMLAETDCCRLLLGRSMVGVEREGQRVTAARLDSGERLSARVFIDATDGALCTAAGCDAMTGQEPQSRFGEHSAPEQPTGRANGVTLIYRLTATGTPAVQPLPRDVPADCWWRPSFPYACVNHYPCADLNVNMLPTMEGEECLALGEKAAYAECRRRVRAHWHWLQNTYSEFRHLRLAWIAPRLGVRETRRVVGEYVLTERDVREGLSGHTHPDIIAIADHALDTHGDHAAGCPELQEPYGIPLRCLIPRGLTNVLVASRAASLSSIAASSCRLSRTIMQLGQAAGTAAHVALTREVALPEVPREEVRGLLREQHVQLEHPLSDDLRAHLTT